MTTGFTLYGLVDYTVQGRNGTSWVTLGIEVGNNRHHQQDPGARDPGCVYRSRVVEVEAWAHKRGWR